MWCWERSTARMGSETRLGKFTAGSNEEAMHTYKEAKTHCLKATTEPQDDLYDQEHTRTQTYSASNCRPPNDLYKHICIKTHNTDLRSTLEALMEPPPSVISHTHSHNDLTERCVWVRTKWAGQQEVMLQLTPSTISTILSKKKLKCAWVSDPHTQGIPEILLNRTLTYCEWTLTF